MDPLRNPYRTLSDPSREPEKEPLFYPDSIGDPLKEQVYRLGLRSAMP